MAPDGTLQLPLDVRPQRRGPTKRCKRCGETRHVSEFHYRPEQHRYRAECKECYRARANELRDPVENRRRVKEWQQANPEKRNAQSRKNYEGRRSDVGRWLAKQSSDDTCVLQAQGNPDRYRGAGSRRHL